MNALQSMPCLFEHCIIMKGGKLVFGMHTHNLVYRCIIISWSFSVFIFLRVEANLLQIKYTNHQFRIHNKISQPNDTIDFKVDKYNIEFWTTSRQNDSFFRRKNSRTRKNQKRKTITCVSCYMSFMFVKCMYIVYAPVNIW